MLNTTVLDLLFQWKYRIEAFEKWACVSGIYGKAAAITSTYNCFVNDKGCANTNKPGDLKVYLIYLKVTWPVNTSTLSCQLHRIELQVEQTNLVYKKRSDLLKGNYTDSSLSLIARLVFDEILHCIVFLDSSKFIISPQKVDGSWRHC